MIITKKKRLRKTSKSYSKKEFSQISKDKNNKKDQDYSSNSSTIENDMIRNNKNDKNSKNPPKMSKKKKTELFPILPKRKNSYQNYPDLKILNRQNRIYSESSNIFEGSNFEIYQNNYDNRKFENFDFKANCNFRQNRFYSESKNILKDLNSEIYQKNLENKNFKNFNFKDDLKFYQKNQKTENSNLKEDLKNYQNEILKKTDQEIYQKNYKTEICKNFEFKGHCQFGEICCFAHGLNELRDKLNENFFYKTKFCEKFFEPNFCPYGYRCQYLHRIIYNKIFFNEYFDKFKKDFVDKKVSVFHQKGSQSNSDFFVIKRLKIFKTITQF